jgi:hypothetical protein
MQVSSFMVQVFNAHRSREKLGEQSASYHPHRRTQHRKSPRHRVRFHRAQPLPPHWHRPNSVLKCQRSLVTAAKRSTIAFGSLDFLLDFLLDPRAPAQYPPQDERPGKRMLLTRPGVKKAISCR